MNTKVCSKCQETFPASNEFFNINRDGLFNLSSRCKTCINNAYKKLKQSPIKENLDPSIYRKCTVCEEEKPAIFEYFYRSPVSNLGLTSACKDCQKKRSSEYKKDNKEKLKIYHELNEDSSILKLCYSCMKMMPATADFFRRCRTNKYGVQSYCKKCDTSLTVRKNKTKINTDLVFKLELSIRSRIKSAIVCKSNIRKTLDLIGLESIEYLRMHLESQFEDWMSWENHAIDTWHIDHIIPCAAYDLSIEENQFKCFNYRNLRPLSASDNHQKGATLDIDLIRSHDIEDLLPAINSF